MKGAAGEAASENIEAAKGAAGRVAQDLMHVAERKELTPAAVADAARSIGDAVKRTSSEAGATGTYRHTEAQKMTATDRPK